MAVLDITKMGHPALRQQAFEVNFDSLTPQDLDDLKELVSDMTDTMAAAGGTGIAAPQVAVLRQVVVYFARSGRGVLPVGEDIPLTTLINPVIEPLGEEILYDWEGCLSVPGLTGLVPRYRHILLSYQDMTGAHHKAEVSGFHARLLQHECDHLWGILYPQRMDDLSLLLFADQLEHGIPEKARAILIDQEASLKTAYGID